MCINASCHGALGVIFVEVTVTNDIPKRYSRDLSATNDIPSVTPHSYALAEMWTWISCLELICSAISIPLSTEIRTLHLIRKFLSHRVN